MPTSHRIWWLLAGCAVAIGLAIEAGTPSDSPSSQSAATTHSAPATAIATRPRRDQGA